MHRRLTFQGRADALGALAGEVAAIDGVIALAHVRGASRKPAGDVLQVDVLNRAADEVIRRADPHLRAQPGQVTLAIAHTNALIDHAHTELIHEDADEMLWEEIESDLRNHGRVSVNYVLLMALGGAIAAVGLQVEPVWEAILFVGASIIAPGFEPVAKLAQGLVLRQWRVCRRALVSIVIGYSVLCGAALVLTFTLSRLPGYFPHTMLMTRPVLPALTHFNLEHLVASGCAAIAGILMVVSLRDLYVVGPLMVLVTISGVALVGAALGVGEGGVALAALGRVGGDVATILVLGAAVFWWKQRRFHRRRPL